MADQFLPVLITLAVAGGFAVALLGFSALVGQRSRQRTRSKCETYESGVPLLDRARKRISIKFYLVALVFVVLDVEVAFLYPWASTIALWLRKGRWFHSGRCSRSSDSRSRLCLSVAQGRL